MTFNAACLAIVTACFVAVVFILAFAPVHAAAPDVPPCEAINALPDGSITVYRCEPNEGLPYLLNSMGFLVVED